MKKLLTIFCLVGTLLASFCIAQTVAPGCEAPTGTDSSEFHRLFGPNAVNPTWWRLQVCWASIETNRGMYDFRALDKQMWACTVSNWASINFPNPQPVQPANMLCICVAPLQAPESYTNSQAAFIGGETNFIKAILARYPGVFRWVEPVNEPDGGCNWIPSCTNATQNAQFSAKLIIASRVAARGVQPNILIAGPSNTSAEDAAWNAAFQQAGGFKALDAITWHDYRMNPMFMSPFDTTAAGLRTLATDCQGMKKFAGNKPMMINEVGIGSVSNAIAFVVVAQKNGVWGLAPVGIMAPGPMTYWDWVNDQFAPNGLALFATINALNRSR